MEYYRMFAMGSVLKASQYSKCIQTLCKSFSIMIWNPLGSHVGKHKIDLYCYTLGNVNRKFRSKLCAIRLLAIVKAKHVSKYGQSKVFTPIGSNLNNLAAGHTFNVQGQSLKLHGAVVWQVIPDKSVSSFIWLHEIHKSIVEIHKSIVEIHKSIVEMHKSIFITQCW